MLKKIGLCIALSSVMMTQVVYAEDIEEPVEQSIEQPEEVIEQTQPQEETEESTEIETTKSEEELLQNSGSGEGTYNQNNTQNYTIPYQAPITDGAVNEYDIIIPSDSSEIEDMEEEKQRIEEEQRQREEDMKAKNEELSSLNNELSNALARINELDVQASELSVKIFETGEKLEEAKEKKAVQYDDMKLRIQYMYEHAENDLLETIFTSKDMAEALNSATYYQQIYDYDRSKLEEFKLTVDEIERFEEEQKKELEEINALKEETDTEKAKLEIFIAEKQGDIDALTRSIAEGEESVAVLNENIKAALDRMASEASARAKYVGNASALLKIAEAAQEEALKEGKANAKMVAVARNAGQGISTFPLIYGWCAAWVSGVYNITGGITPPHGNAIDYWNKWKASGSTRMDNVPIGACVISSGDPTYGHIGIYLGGGIVASNLGYCKVETIESFGASATAVCQGHRGYIGWVWPNGQSLL